MSSTPDHTPEGLAYMAHRIKMQQGKAVMDVMDTIAGGRDASEIDDRMIAALSAARMFDEKSGTLTPTGWRVWAHHRTTNGPNGGALGLREVASLPLEDRRDLYLAAARIRFRHHNEAYLRNQRDQMAARLELLADDSASPGLELFGEWKDSNDALASADLAEDLDIGLTIRLLISEDDHPTDWGDIVASDAEREATTSYCATAIVFGDDGSELFRDGIVGVDAINLPGFPIRSWKDAACHAWTEYLANPIKAFAAHHVVDTAWSNGFRDGALGVPADAGRWNDGGQRLADYHRGYLAGERGELPQTVTRALYGRDAVMSGCPDRDDDPATHASDAMTNIMHYLDSLGLNPTSTLETAQNNFRSERSDLLAAVTDGFVRALLWADATPRAPNGCDDYTGERGGLENREPTPDLRHECWSLCARFLAVASAEDIDAHMKAFGDPDGGHPGEFIGHTFYLDAAGHGVSFTDRAWKDDDPMTAVCERLRDVAQTFGEVEHFMAYELADGRVGL